MKKILVVGLITGLTSLYASDQITTRSMATSCFNIDWDGIVAEDVAPKIQFKNAMSVVPTHIIVNTLFWNIPLVCKIVINSKLKKHFNIDLKMGLYDKHGNKLLGHYECIQAFAANAPSLQPYCSKIIEKLAEATPHYKTIARIQEWQNKGAKVIVWTNNDEPMLKAKLACLNHRLTSEGKEPLHIDSYFVIGGDDHRPNISRIAKPEMAYYQKAFAYTQSITGDTGSWSHYFIDDKVENIVTPNDFAQQQNVNLTALHHETQDGFIELLATSQPQLYRQAEALA